MFLLLSANKNMGFFFASFIDEILNDLLIKYIRIVIALAFLSTLFTATLSTLFTATTYDDSTVYRADVALVNNTG